MCGVLIPELEPPSLLAEDVVIRRAWFDDLGRLLAFLAKTVRLDFIPRANSAKLILASPSMSKRLKIPISSYFVAKWPIDRKNLFRLLLSM